MKRTLSRHHSNKGTVLIAAMSIIVVIAGLSLVMMKSTQNNVREYKQEKRKAQAEQVSDSAVSIGIHHLNNNLLDTSEDPGTLAGSVHVVHSGDSDNEPLVLEGTTERAHPETDRLDNDDDGTIDENGEGNPLVDPNTDDVKSNGSYLGGLYRVKIQEWVGADQEPDPPNGVPDILENGVDDDNDGTDDNIEEKFIGAKDLNDNGRDEESMNFHTSSNSRYFTLAVEATYANYTVEMRAVTNAIQISADKFGIYSNGSLDIKGSIDSYDSSSGSYSTASSKSNGNVAADGGALTVHASGEVYGDAKYTSGYDNRGTVTGEEGSLSDDQTTSAWSISSPTLETRSNGIYTASDGETISSMDQEGLEVLSGETATLASGETHYLGSWGGQNGTNNDSSAIQNNGTLQIGDKSTNTTVYVQDDLTPRKNSTLKIYGPDSVDKTPTKVYVADDVRLKNHSQLTIEGHVELYVVDEMEFDSNSNFTNNNTNTALFEANVGGEWDTSTSDGEVHLFPKQNFKGFLNAPTAREVEIKPNGEFYGAVIGNNTTVKPGGGFHYDERISDLCKELDNVNCNWVVRDHDSWIIERRGSSLGE